jgi:fermentation-respiration switch protein FrsA (DUF1100 family)
MIVVYIILGIIGFYLLLSLIVFFVVFGRPRSLDLTKMKGFEYKDIIIKAKEQMKDKPFTTVTIRSFDRVKLEGYLYEIKNPTATIVLVHGYSSNGVQDFCSVFDYYQSFGFNILIVNQRAHGKSGGHFCTFGIKESKDIIAWSNYLNSRFPNIPLRYSGISLGSSTLLYASDKLPSNAISIIADAGFTSPYDIIKHVSRSYVHIPPFLFIGILRLEAFLFLHIRLKQSAITSVSQTKIPIFFLHGRADNFVPFWMGEHLFDAASSLKTAAFVEGAAHGCSYLKDPKGVIEGITKFFEETSTT